MGRYDDTKDKKHTGVLIFTLVILVVAAAGGFYFFYFDTQQTVSSELVKSKIQALLLPLVDKESVQEEPLPTPESEAEDTGAAIEAIEQPLPEEPFVLPDLLDSDDLFRESLIEVSPKLAEWLRTDQLVRKYVVIANDFSQGLTIGKHMHFLKPEPPFAVVQKDDNNQEFIIAAKNYQRFDALASAIDALDVQAALDVYKKFRPLFQQVFDEFGYPEEYSLDDIFTKAAAEILTAPVIEGEIALVRPGVLYKFADGKLEGLNRVHKQMLRMGPENTRVIQNKIRLLVQGLVNEKD
jgi:hypothetical protein